MRNDLICSCGGRRVKTSSKLRGDGTITAFTCLWCLRQERETRNSGKLLRWQHRRMTRAAVEAFLVDAGAVEHVSSIRAITINQG